MTTATIKVGNNLTFTVESDNELDLMRKMSRIYEIFGFTQCGHCYSDDIRPVCRTTLDGTEWIELVCQKCRAKLPYGKQKKDSNVIYPKLRWADLEKSGTAIKERKNEKEYADQHGGFLPNQGWYIYKGNKND